jgi:hypothetical protein
MLSIEMVPETLVSFDRLMLGTEMVPETSVSFDHLNAVGHKDGSRNVGFF